MKVLMISGDKNVLVPSTPAHARLELQKKQVEKLEVVFWGRGALTSVFKIRECFDVVTAQDPFWRGLAGFVLARRMRARLNVQVHADLVGQSWLKKGIANFLLRRADSIRVVSQKIKGVLVAAGVRAPIHVLPIFIDVARFQNLQKKQHPKFAKVILWIGRLESEKNPAEAIEVLKEVRAKGIDAGLIFLGGGSLEHTLRAQAASLAQWVEFAGWQHDTLPYLAMADVELSTSRHESYGASIIEALAAGVPVVSYDVGVARDAGATIAPRGGLAKATVAALQSGRRSTLQISLLSADAWGPAWKETL